MRKKTGVYYTGNRKRNQYIGLKSQSCSAAKNSSSNEGRIRENKRTNPKYPLNMTEGKPYYFFQHLQDRARLHWYTIFEENEQILTFQFPVPLEKREKKNRKEKDYYFMDKKRLKKKLKTGEFVEYEEVYDGIYTGR